MRSLLAINRLLLHRNCVFRQETCEIFTQLLRVCMCKQWRDKGAYSHLQWRPKGFVTLWNSGVKKDVY